MGTFFSAEEIEKIGIKAYGEDVLISRNAILYNPEKLFIGSHVRIDDFCTISGNVVLGNYIHIAQFCSLYGDKEGIEMKDFSGLSSKVSIYATSNDYSGKSMTNPMVPEKYKPGDKSEHIYIGKHAIIGCNSVILPGAKISDGCSVGAMSLCNKPLDEWGIYAGIPAKKIKEREKELLQYEQQMQQDLLEFMP